MVAAVLGLLASGAFALLPAGAQESAPANTLINLRRALAACLARTPLAAGSQATIVFMTRRDGSILGRPRISYAHLEGDADAQRRFLVAAERAVDSCFPLKLTPALGAAIAGRLFSITIGRERPQSGA